MAQTTNAEPELSPKDKEIKPGEVSMLGRSVFLCSFCGKGYNTRRDLLVHQWTHKERQTFVCQTCDKTFSNENMFRRHMSVHVREEKRFVSCEICKKVFRNNRNLEEHHLKAHMGQKPHECGTCGAQFSWKENLAKHMRVHIDKPFACRVCHEAFKDKTALRIHLRSHRLQVQTEKSIQDSVPKSPFTEKKSVNSENIADKLDQEPTNKIPMPWMAKLQTSEVAAKLYGSSKKMSSEAEEDDDKPFKCTKCGHAFLYKFSMEAHMKGHAESSPNPAAMKNLTGSGAVVSSNDTALFPRNPVLEKPYKCHLCEETFRWSFCLDAHIKIHQQEEAREQNGEDVEVSKPSRHRSGKKAKFTHVVTVSEEPTRVVTITKKTMENNLRPSRPVSLKRPKKQVDMMEKIKAQKTKNLGTMYEKAKTVNYLNKPKLNKNVCDVKKRKVVRKGGNLEAGNQSVSLGSPDAVKPDSGMVEKPEDANAEESGERLEECSVENIPVDDMSPLVAAKHKVDCATQVELDDVSDEMMEDEATSVVKCTEKRMSDAFTQADDVEEMMSDTEEEIRDTLGVKKRKFMENISGSISEEEQDEKLVEEEINMGNLQSGHEQMTDGQEETLEQVEPNIHIGMRKENKGKKIENDGRPYETGRNSEPGSENESVSVHTDDDLSSQKVTKVPRKCQKKKSPKQQRQRGKAQANTDLKSAVIKPPKRRGRKPKQIGQLEHESIGNAIQNDKEKGFEANSIPDKVCRDISRDRSKVIEGKQIPKKKKGGKRKPRYEEAALPQSFDINSDTSEELNEEYIDAKSPRQMSNKVSTVSVEHKDLFAGDDPSSEKTLVPQGLTVPVKRGKSSKSKSKKSRQTKAKSVVEKDVYVSDSDDCKIATLMKPSGQQQKRGKRNRTDQFSVLGDSAGWMKDGQSIGSEMPTEQKINEVEPNLERGLTGGHHGGSDPIPEEHKKKGKGRKKSDKKTKKLCVSSEYDQKTSDDEQSLCASGNDHIGQRNLKKAHTKAVVKCKGKKHRKSDTIKSSVASIDRQTNDEEELFDDPLQAPVSDLESEGELPQGEPAHAESAVPADQDARSKINLKVRVFTCDMCGKAFMEKLALSAHKLLHAVAREQSEIETTNSVNNMPTASPRSRKQKHPRKSPHKV